MCISLALFQDAKYHVECSSHTHTLQLSLVFLLFDLILVQHLEFGYCDQLKKDGRYPAGSWMFSG